MTEDVNGIQTQETIEGAIVESEGETPTETQPLTSEDITRLVQEQVDAKTIELDKKWQSVTDRGIKAANVEVKQLKKRAELAEFSMAEVNKLAVANPQLAQSLRVAQVEAQSRAFKEQDNQANMERMKLEFVDDMKDTLSNLGVDPEDTRIDWADNAPTPQKRNKAILLSVSKILKDANPADKKEIDKITKETEQKLRKELDVDSIDNTTSMGHTNKSGLPDSVSKAKNPTEARRALDEFVKGV